MNPQSEDWDGAVSYLLEHLSATKNLQGLKSVLAKDFHLLKIPSNIDLLNRLNKEQRELFKQYLLSKPTRTISGVAPLAVMTKPVDCPHVKRVGGPCSYCPGGPKSFFGDVPQSYTGNEPASMRGKRANYDPYVQAFNRLEQYVVMGYIPQKIEVIIMGGTFPATSKIYQDEFVSFILKALNDFSDLFFSQGELDVASFSEFFELPGSVHDEKRVQKIKEKVLELKENSSLKQEQKRNETSFLRCVALCIETRPDIGFLASGNQMLRLGCTRIELGIQSLNNKTLEKIRRGHAVEDSMQSIQILKDLGFKIGVHMMPGLPYSSPEQDIAEIKQLFNDARFQPDMLKIYPCLVMEGTELYKWYKRGEFKPLTNEQAIEILKEVLPSIPEYCRIIRVQRDIPSTKTTAGLNRTNIRQDLESVPCKDIRQREAGHQWNKYKKLPKKIDLVVREYEASQGKEFFISFEDIKQDILIGYCRLRFPSQFLREEITLDSGIVRELHVFSEALNLSEKKETSFQHRGFGSQLLKKAEEICKENKKNKVVIISGIGVREYYEKKHGYRREGPYMVKDILPMLH